MTGQETATLNLLISPHNDDETLFTAYTLCAERETIQVVVVFDGYIQTLRGEPVTHLKRHAETLAAMKELGVVHTPIFGECNDAQPAWERVENLFRGLRSSFDPVTTYIPWQEPGGHEQHNMVGRIAERIFNRCTHYTTYSRTGKTIGSRVVIPEPDWIARKHRALACYTSQIRVENCREHFTRDMREYYA